MKKSILLLTALLTSCLILGSCTKQTAGNLSEKEIEEATQNNEEDKTAEEVPVSDEEGKEQKETEAKKELTAEDMLAEISAFTDSSMEIDPIAHVFMESLVNADLNTVAQYVSGSPENYSFLKDVQITSYELLPFSFREEDKKENYYYYDHQAKYLCTINTNGKSDVFGDETSYYYLATDEMSATGNQVCYFCPFENTKLLFVDYSKPQDEFTLLTDNFIDAYSPVLTDGRNNASDFDFHNLDGYHFIPHMMFALENDWNFDRPHSMNEINDFISLVFNGNTGVELKTEQDFMLWVSDAGYDGEYTPDAEIYGCYYGHGGKSISHFITSMENDGDGVTITAETYADLANFAKAKTLVFRYAPDEKDALPCLYGIEVTDNTGLTEAGCSF